MMETLAALLLLLGAVICLLAALGLFRLGDFFLRMHAATKAGVAGCGLILLSAGFLEPTAGTWIKVLLAIVFLLLTTPLAGHLLGRAGYVGGVPLWSGTVEDRLAEVLPRGAFDGAAGGSGGARVAGVTVALAAGPASGPLIEHAVALASRHGVPLTGLAIIDTPLLENVGSVPLGANWHAERLRAHRIAAARQVLAGTIEALERQAALAGIAQRLRVEEGAPAPLLRAAATPGHLLLAAPDAWFDQGVLALEQGAFRRLLRSGAAPLLLPLAPPRPVQEVEFLHDGTPQSEAALDWLREHGPWPDVALRLTALHAGAAPAVAAAVERLRAAGQRLALGAGGQAAAAEVLVVGNARRHRQFPATAGRVLLVLT